MAKLPADTAVMQILYGELPLSAFDRIDADLNGLRQ